MDLQVLYGQYEESFSVYQKFCQYLERELRELINATNVPYFELTYRIKTWDSIKEKIGRNSLQPNSIQDIHDIIGFRVIILFKRDVLTICNMIRDNLAVLWEDDKAAEKPDDVFGYLSIHFQIKLPAQWLHIPTADGFAELQAELQIRTFSQHIWAASSHLLQYKREAAIPAVMRRNIYRLAAVLEIVDNELEAILTSRQTYQESIKNKTVDDRNNQILDSILLEQILDQAFGGKNKRPQEPYDLLLQELFSCGIKTTGQLLNMLSAGKEEIVRQENRRGSSFYSYTGKLRMALKFYAPELYAKIMR